MASSGPRAAEITAGTERDRHRQTDRQTERERERDREKRRRPEHRASRTGAGSNSNAPGDTETTLSHRRSAENRGN